MLPNRAVEFLLNRTVLTEFIHRFGMTVTGMKGVCHCLTDEHLFAIIMCLWISDKAKRYSPPHGARLLVLNRNGGSDNRLILDQWSLYTVVLGLELFASPTVVNDL